jgi:hypothetical protein
MDSPQAMYSEQQAAFLPVEGEAADAPGVYSTCCDCCYGCGCDDGCVQACNRCLPGTACCRPPCCARPRCCQPGACCAPNGRCPCFCTPFVAAFAVVISLLFSSFALLVSVLDVNTLILGNGGDVSVGAFDYCIRPWSCKSLTYSMILQASNLDMFQSFRAITIIATMTCFTAAILACIRLMKQQRGQLISARLEGAVLSSACLSLLCCAISFSLLTRIAAGFDFSGIGYHRVSPTLGPGWGLLLGALMLAIIAVAIHIITLIAYRCTRKTAAAMPDPEAANLQLLQALQRQQLARLQQLGPAYYPAHAHPAYGLPSHQQLPYLAPLPASASAPAASAPMPAAIAHYPSSTRSDTTGTASSTAC